MSVNIPIFNPSPSRRASHSLRKQTAWYAIRTRSRHEKKVATLLAERSIAAFLPLIREIHRWSDRRKIVSQPLFPGHVFVRLDNSDESYLRVLETPGVVGFVGPQGDGTPIPDRQIKNIQTVLGADVPFGVLPFLHAGQKVRIRGGRLNGIEGNLVEINYRRSVVVFIEAIRKSLTICASGFRLEFV